MKRENVDKVVAWFKKRTAGRPPEGKWVWTRELNEVCKTLDVPISYLFAHRIFSECKGACQLLEREEKEEEINGR